MKKLLIAFALLVLAGCAKTDPSNRPASETSAERLHFYGVARVDETRGVAQMDKLWYNGTTISVKFLNGSTADKAIVQDVAAEWEQYANIKFRFVDSGNAHVRIHFDVDEERWVTWSYTGTDCKFITDQTVPTALFSFWEDLSQGEKYADCRRAFGQILGLELEHRHLDFDPDWRSATAVKNYWGGELPGVAWDELRRYVFDPLDEMNVPENIVQTPEFDAASIMIWPFPRSASNNTDIRYANEELSAQDIVFIGQLYPKTPEVRELITIIMGGSPYYPVDIFPEFYGRKNISIDFGKGVSWKGTANEYGRYDDLQFPYLYKDDAVTVWGEADAVSGMWASGGNLLESISIPEYTELKGFMFSDIEYLGSLDVLHNPFIEILCFGGMTIGHLDLTGLPSLHTLDLGIDNVEEFIFPDNIPSLQKVVIRSPMITNELFMTNFVNSLPDRTGLSEPGYYNFSSGLPDIITLSQSVLNILASKNWVLGPDSYWADFGAIVL